MYMYIYIYIEKERNCILHIHCLGRTVYASQQLCCHDPVYKSITTAAVMTI